MRLSCVAIALCAVVSSPMIHAQNAARGAVRAFDVTEKSIEQLQQAMQAGEITSRELVELYLARIEAYDQRGPALNAIISINARAREQASQLDEERAAKTLRGPLHGIPVLVKDNYETVEMPTTAGSIALAKFHPRRDAALVSRLRAAGAVILAKTTMHELAAGITTVGSSFGQARNPYDLDRTPGGSSGGSGAAVAANFATAGMGSDTCGSIRIPAANNNLVGLRGTQGLSSRAGIVPLSSSQDIGGPLARNIVDLAIMLDATVAPDLADPQTLTPEALEAAGITLPELKSAALGSSSGGRSFRRDLDGGALKEARIGVVRSLFGTTPEDQEVTTIINRSIEALKKAGSAVSDVVIPGVDELLADSSMIGPDFKFDLMEYLARSPDAPVKSLAEILDKGLFHSELENTFRTRNRPETRETDATRRARIKQAALRAVVRALLNEQRLDAILYPTLRRRPARIGDAQGGTNCSLSAHSGLPSLSVPAGFTNDGVPIGMELLGDAFTEQQLLSLGYAIEQRLQLRQSPFSTPPLVSGKVPPTRTTRISAYGGTVDLSYEEVTSRLRFSLAPDSKTKDSLAAVWLHSGTRDSVGAARHQLFNHRRRDLLTGEIKLSAGDRRDLREGHVSLRFYPSGRGESVTVHLPEVRAWQ